MFRSKNKSSGLKLFITIFVGASIIVYGWQLMVNAIFSLGYGSLLAPIGLYSGEITYNKFLASRGSGDISEIVNTSIPRYEREKYELIGDSLYIKSESRDTVLSWYTRSLAIGDHPRVREKIVLLGSGSTQPTVSSGSTTSTGGEQGSGVLEEITQAQKRIEISTESRGTYIQKSGSDQTLRDTIDFLDLGVERADW